MRGCCIWWSWMHRNPLEGLALVVKSVSGQVNQIIALKLRLYFFYYVFLSRPHYVIPIKLKWTKKDTRRVLWQCYWEPLQQKHSISHLASEIKVCEVIPRREKIVTNVQVFQLVWGCLSGKTEVTLSEWVAPRSKRRRRRKRLKELLLSLSAYKDEWKLSGFFLFFNFAAMRFKNTFCFSLVLFLAFWGSF